jgi:hypothetical protein
MEKITLPLKRIPYPPTTYIEFKALTYGLDQEEYEKIKRKFLKEHNCKKEIEDYSRLFESIINYNYENSISPNYNFIGEGITPIEKIELIEADGKKHGNVKWMMIYDIEYFYHKDKLIQRKLYIPLKWKQNY